MANIVYQAGLKELFEAATTIAAGTWEAILERSTSTYSPDKDDDSLLDKAGWVEISVASYAREAITGEAVSVVDASDAVKIDVADIDFGTLEAGQTVKAVIIARNDAGNYVPLLRIDTDSGGLLPRALGGGNFSITINASGLFTVAQA